MADSPPGPEGNMKEAYIERVKGIAREIRTTLMRLEAAGHSPVNADGKKALDEGRKFLTKVDNGQYLTLAIETSDRFISYVTDLSKQLFAMANNLDSVSNVSNEPTTPFEGDPGYQEALAAPVSAPCSPGDMDPKPISSPKPTPGGSPTTVSPTIQAPPVQSPPAPPIPPADTPEQESALRKHVLPELSIPIVPAAASPNAAMRSAPSMVDPLTVPAPAPNPAVGWPQTASPAIYFLCRRLEAARTEPEWVAQVKKKIDEAPALMANFGKACALSIPMDIPGVLSFSLDHASVELERDFGLRATFANGALHLAGIPTQGFDDPLHFIFRDVAEAAATHIHARPLYVSADPRTLWKDLPVTDDEGYPIPNEECQGQRFSTWAKTVVAASVRGRSHAHVGKPRDDHFSFSFDDASGWGFLAVADGAGSAKYSRKGSQLACTVALDVLRAYFADPAFNEQIAGEGATLAAWRRDFLQTSGEIPPERETAYRRAFQFDNVFHKAVYDAYLAIHAESKEKGAQPKDYHTTLLCAAMKRFAEGYFIASYWVGDGGMALCGWNRSERVFVLGMPDGGEFAGQTRFLTAKEEIIDTAIRRRMRFTFCDEFEALVLVTDGITDPFFPSEKEVAGAANWRRFLRDTLRRGDEENAGCPTLFDDGRAPGERADALRAWLGFWSKGNHDDRTLLAVL